MVLLVTHVNPDPRGVISKIEVYDDRKIRYFRDESKRDAWPVLLRKDALGLTDEEWVANPFTA